ncbi:kinase-like domain-containing protein [Rhizoctonia solani]|nr:kinase-like domain-containing protein [Rhizoctonia solani]
MTSYEIPWTCTQICDGLLYLHQIGIIHEDLKEVNILVSDEGVPVLINFGNALLAHHTLKFTQTTSNDSLMVRWASAKLIMESGEPGKASDVYALVMVDVSTKLYAHIMMDNLLQTIYEAMMGQVPYYGKSKTSIIYLVAVKKVSPEQLTTMHSVHRDGDELLDLLLHCWSFELSAHPSSAEVLKLDGRIYNELADADYVVNHRP